MKIYTKESLTQALREIREMGWIPSHRAGNDGAIGNTLEDLLGIPENNLPIPNATEWELKTQRKGANSLVTLFHMEPSPRALKFVPNILLPNYGWKHSKAGEKYPDDERSFRQTIHGASRSDRGFSVLIDRKERKVLISFDAHAVAPRHYAWLKEVEEKVGLGELSPQPYWGFDDLEHKAGTKLLNCFFVEAERKREKGQYFFRYASIFILRSFSLEKLLQGLEKGFVYIDFDARTGHNHGTKFRIRRQQFLNLYEEIQEL